MEEKELTFDEMIERINKWRHDMIDNFNQDIYRMTDFNVIKGTLKGVIEDLQYSFNISIELAKRLKILKQELKDLKDKMT